MLDVAVSEDPSEASNFSSIRRVSFKDTSLSENIRAGQPSDISYSAKISDRDLRDKVPDHLKDLYDTSSEGKEQWVKERLVDIFCKHESTFSKDETDIGLTHLAVHNIDTGDAKPIKMAPRRVPLAFKGQDTECVNKMLKSGSIRPSSSPWAAPVVLVKKKNGSTRLCADYRFLNAVTRKDSFPLPKISEALDAIAGSKFLSVMDLTSAFQQVAVNPADIPKTAFVTTGGLWECTRLCFGLSGGPATFQRVMELALRGLNWATCLVYLDDVLIFGPTLDSHLSRLEEVLDRVKEANLKIMPKKCNFLAESVCFLGHIVSGDGVRPNPTNVSKILGWKRPENASDIRSFVQTARYYARFVKGFSDIAKPLTDLTCDKVAFAWSPECEEAFNKIKAALTGPEVMAYPLEDGGEFILDTDASATCIGAVLSQIQNNEERVICYGSKTMNRAQTRYCTTDRELLAVRYFVEYYKHYLLGRKFLIRTDHRALTWLLSLKNPKSRVARWIEILASYVFEIQYRPGKNHANADGMSRCKDPWNCSCEQLDEDSQQFLSCGPCRKCQKRAEDVVDSFEEGRIRRCSPNNVQTGFSSPFVLLAMFMCIGLLSPYVNLDVLSSILLFLASAMPISADFVSVSNVFTVLLVFVSWFKSPCMSTSIPGRSVRCAKVSLPDDGRMRPKPRAGTQTKSGGVLCSGTVSSFGAGLVQSCRMVREDNTPTDPWCQGYTTEELLEKQCQDPVLKHVHSWVKKGCRPDKQEISACGAAVRHFWIFFHTLSLSNGLLVRQYTKQDGTGSYTQFLVPNVLKDEILKQMHDNLLSAHLGTRKTEQKLLQRFYWFDVRNDVKLWVAACDVCQVNKPLPSKFLAPLGSMPVGSVLDKLSVDMLGPLPKTARANTFILVVVDHFSKWTEIFPVPNEKAETVARVLLNEVICRWGCPLDLHSDQGRNFQSQIFAELCELLEIRKTRTTARHPSGNGLCERFMKTLVSMIKAYLKGQQRNWDLNLGCLAGAFRATPQESTSLTPNLVMLGREVCLPHEVVFGSSTSSRYEMVSSYGSYVRDLQNKLNLAHEITRKHLEKSAQKQKSHYDVKSVFHKYKVGDIIWLRNEVCKVGECQKLLPAYVGPYIVCKVFNDRNYKIILNANGKNKVVHHDKMRPYKGHSPPAWLSSVPLPSA